MTKDTENSKNATFPGQKSTFSRDPGYFLPASQNAIARLLDFFGGNFHDWIYAPNVYRHAPEEKPDYSTENRYPIEPRILAEMYADPEVLVGLRFGSKTRWGGFDIDAGSILNPLAPNSRLSADSDTRRRAAEENLTRLKETAERYGLIAPTIWQSSYGGGIWIAWAFPETLKTIELAALLSAISEEAGFKLKSGQLEAFPNVKAYQNTSDRRQFTKFKAYRLPLQPETGGYLLNDDLEPISGDIEALLNDLEFSTSKIDLEEVQRSCALAYTSLKARVFGNRWKSAKGAREAWINDLTKIIRQGFTAHHQTNDLLGKIGCLGRIRDGLSGVDLAAFIEETVTSLPGYETYCRHQQEITNRAREWAASAERFYWHINSPDKSRHGSYQEMFEFANAETPREDKAAAYHERRNKSTLEQLETALLTLQGREDISTLSALFAAVCQTSKELFGKAFSKRTWQKYKEQFTKLIADLIRPKPEAEEPLCTTLLSPVAFPLETAETQENSGSTPCFPKLEKIEAVETVETQENSGSTPCFPNIKVFAPPFAAQPESEVFSFRTKPAPEFTLTQVFPIATPSLLCYAVGHAVEFWNTFTRNWTKARIVNLVYEQGYFVHCKVRYWAFGKLRVETICRDDWLRPRPG